MRSALIWAVRAWLGDEVGAGGAALDHQVWDRAGEDRHPDHRRETARDPRGATSQKPTREPGSEHDHDR